MAGPTMEPKEKKSFTREGSVSVAARISKSLNRDFKKLIPAGKGESGKKLRELIQEFVSKNK